MNTAIKWLRHCCQRMAKGWIFTAVGLLTLFFAHPHLAYACKYQNINNAPCPYDCKEDGGEVACLAPIPVPYTANTLTDKNKWQYGNLWFPGRDEDPFIFCVANGGTIVADNVPNSCHGLPAGYVPGAYGKSYYAEGLVSTAASNFANFAYSDCPPTGSSNTGWGLSNTGTAFDYAPKVGDYTVSGILVRSYRRMVFSGALKKQPNGTCGGPPIDVTVDAIKRRSVACPSGTTQRELTNSSDRQRIVRCVPDLLMELTCPAGNPTAPARGAKLETSVDYQGAGAHPLIFERKYNSRALTTTDNPFSATAPWSHNYARTLQPQGVPNVSGSVIAQLMLYSSSVDQRLLYRLQTDGTWLADTPGNRNTLTEIKDVAQVRTGWQHKLWADDTVETYNADGVLLTVKQRNGWTTTLTYSDAATPVANYLKPSASVAAPAPIAGLLISVKNHFGRELKLTYEAVSVGGAVQARLKELLPPGAVSGSGAGLAQSPIVYAYEEAANLGTNIPKQGQLTSVTWQDGAVRNYLYTPESSDLHHHLTGITDEAGVRIGTYTYLNSYYAGYHNHGKVASTQKASGAEKLEFSYSPAVRGYATGYGTATTIITDTSGPNGSATTRSYTIQVQNGVARPLEVTAPCPTCGSTQQSTVYGDGTAANGGLGAKDQPIKTVAHDGTVTFTAYDAKGRETEKATYPSSYASATTRPALNLATSVVSSRWHPSFNLLTKRAEPGKFTVWTYANDTGNLTAQSETITTDATGAATFNAVQKPNTAVKSTGWAYHATMQLPTTIVERETAYGAAAIETGRWTYAYNATGNLMSARDVTRNRTGTASSHDAQGRMLAGKNDVGVNLGYVYTARGFVKQKTVNGNTINFTQNAIGLTTEVRTPDNQVFTLVYDNNHRLIDVKQNGASITVSMLSSGYYPDSYLKAQIAQWAELLQGGADWLVLPAMAQVPVPFPRPVVPAPGQPMPGQPDDDPFGLNNVRPMNDADRLARRLAEEAARKCECKPDEGYKKPTYTNVTYFHLLFGGHLSKTFADQSYFAATENVRQALVDEIVSKTPGGPTNSRGRLEYVANLGRLVGYVTDPTAPTGWRETAIVKMIVEKDNCTSKFRSGNEVVTMYPFIPR
jgi:YD repeat-containing protein